MSSVTKVIRHAVEALRFFSSNPLVVNAYVTKNAGRVRPVNWGDDLNHHFIHQLTGRDIAIYFDTPVAMALKRANYLCIGSTLNYLTTPETIVWGAGVIDETSELRATPACVHAVRGPLTRDYLLARGIECPEVYGDPALLIPYFYKPAAPAMPRGVGILPHYKDQGAPIFRSIRDKHPDLRFIDVANYTSWTDIIDQVCGCSAVFSSSLHGLVIAEAFGIPNYWIEVSDNVIGRGFKFRDYFASLGKVGIDPIAFDEGTDPASLLASLTWKPGRIDLPHLLAACPFDIKEPVRFEHPLDGVNPQMAA